MFLFANTFSGLKHFRMEKYYYLYLSLKNANAKDVKATPDTKDVPEGRSFLTRTKGPDERLLFDIDDLFRTSHRYFEAGSRYQERR